MEFHLPLPNLQDIAGLAVVHTVMDLEAGRRYWVGNVASNLQESSEKIDKLEIPKALKLRVQELLKGTFDHITAWFKAPGESIIGRYTVSPRLLFDVYGRIDELRLVRQHLERCYEDREYDSDINALKELLGMACYYTSLPDIHFILLKILNLCAQDEEIPDLAEPEFKIVNERLNLKYKYVDLRGASREFSCSFSYLSWFSEVFTTKTEFNITLRSCCHDLHLFRLHVKLYEPSKRMPFIKRLLEQKAVHGHSNHILKILNFLDPVAREHLLRYELHGRSATKFLSNLLTWPFQVFFMSAFGHVKSSLCRNCYFRLFDILFKKLDIEVFEDIFLQFWKAVPLSRRPNYSRLIQNNCNSKTPEPVEVEIPVQRTPTISKRAARVIPRTYNVCPYNLRRPQKRKD